MKDVELSGLDTNVLVYADDPSSPNHTKAKSYLEDALKGTQRVCLSPQVLAEYFSVITSPKTVKTPLRVEDAKERLLFLDRTRAIKKIYPKRFTLRRCVEFCARKDITGVRIFDAIYAMTLLDNRVHKLFTQNVKDFIAFKELGLELVDPFSSQES